MTAAAPDVLHTRFRALDPQVPLLAAKAAVQLDNVRLWAEGKLTKQFRIDAVKNLADRLRGATQEASANRTANTRSLFDPITDRVLSTALAQSHGGGRGEDEELGVAADSLTVLVEAVEEGQRVALDELAIWRDFCIALSSLAASKQQTIYGTRPHFRHRR